MQSNLGKRVNIFFIILIDVALLLGGYLIAFLVRFYNHIPEYNIDPFWNVVPWMILVSIVVFFLFDLYSPILRKSLNNIMFSVGISVFLLSLILVASSFWLRGFALPRSVIFLGFLFHLSLMLCFRIMIWFISYYRNGKKKVLIVGKDPEYGLKSAEKLLLHPKGWYTFYSFIPFNQHRKLKELLISTDVILLTPDLSKEEKAETIRLCTRYQKEVLLVPDLYELYLTGADAQQVGDMLVFSILPPNLKPGQRLIKRSFDLIVSLTMILLLSPIMLLLLILIPINSKGEAIFKQERLGRHGKSYMIYKFRSMIKDAEATTGPILATDRDPRITPLGHFLRAMRLDELPQLFNVLKGDMSLVGPRPERAFFIDQFKGEIPDYSYRLMVKPGITGLAQVMANYSTSVEDKLRYDLMYIKNYSFFLDFKILLMTLIVVFRKEQASGVKTGITDKQKEIMKVLNL